MKGDERRMGKKKRWVYMNRTFVSKFQASCLKARIEDNWHNGYEIGPVVEIIQLKSGKYAVRYTYDENELI